MYLALPGVIAFALFELQGDQVSMMDEAYPQLVAQVVPAPLMGFFAAVMLGAILSSFNSVLNSVDTRTLPKKSWSRSARTSASSSRC